MKFVTYRHRGRVELGVLKGETKLVPLKELYNQLGEQVPEDMNALIDAFRSNDLPLFSKLLNETEALLDIKEVELLAPIPYPRRSIICLGKNYLDHALETMGIPGGTTEIPTHPVYFAKEAAPALGHQALIPNHHTITQELDYEVELALIIGKDGVDIPKDSAMAHVFGYTILNDISARDLQRLHGQWFKGKSLDGFCPMGPVILHASEWQGAIEKDIRCTVNGDLRQDSNTRMLIFDIPTIISDLSKGMMLKRGDIISTGTPAGVGFGFKPPKYLKSGDVVACTIEGIGTLINTVE